MKLKIARSLTAIRAQRTSEYKASHPPVELNTGDAPPTGWENMNTTTDNATLTPAQQIFRNYEKSNYGSELLKKAKAEHSALLAVAEALKATDELLSRALLNGFDDQMLANDTALSALNAIRK